MLHRRSSVMEVLPEGPEGRSASSTAPAVLDGDRGPSAAAELRIILKGNDAPGEREELEDYPAWTVNRVLGWLRWLVPAAVWVRVSVPGTEAGRLLRMLERVTIAVTWSATVLGTLFGASAHLPPIGTIIVVVLETVVPAVILRARRRDNDE
jgi:hypothetical protein